MERTNARRRRDLRPVIGDRLERRDLMAVNLGAAALNQNVLRFQRQAVLRQELSLNRGGIVTGFTTDGGAAVTLTDVDGERYRVSVLNGGTVVAQPMPGGRVGLFILGTGPTSQVEINNIGTIPTQGYAHQFAYRQAFQDHRLNVGLIDVVDGQIDGIFGYGTTALSGPLIVRSTQDVDRIALAELRPGASITVGGTLNQLEILYDATMTNPTDGVYIGRDLNVFNVNQNLTLSGGANVNIGRDLGLVNQPAEGTGLGGAGARIGGNLVVASPSKFIVQRDVRAPIAVFGNFIGTNNLQVNGVLPPSAVQVFGVSVPAA